MHRFTPSSVHFNAGIAACSYLLLSLTLSLTRSNYNWADIKSRSCWHWVIKYLWQQGSQSQWDSVPGPISNGDEVFFKRLMCRYKSQPKHCAWSWPASLPMSWKLFIEDERICSHIRPMSLQEGWAKNLCPVPNNTLHAYGFVLCDNILEVYFWMSNVLT